MLNIITGPARSGKSENIMRQIKSLAAAEKRATLLVPESYSHQAEKRMLELCGNEGGRFATVITFSKLERELLRESGLHPRTADAAGRVLYMYLALSRAKSALEVYKTASKPQMIGKLLETVDELVACKITPEMLLKAAEEDSLPAKIHDIAVIYAAFQAEIEAGGLDPRDPFDLAVAQIERSEKLRGAHVFIDGFSGFTTQRYDALSRILQCAGSLSVALLLDESDEILFTRQLKTRDRLAETARRAGVPVTYTALADRENAPLSRLARSAFFHGALSESVEGSTLNIYTCANPHEECELVAALARRIVLTSGARARDITVVCPDMDGYTSLLENAFARYDVPLFTSVAEDVLSKPPLLGVLGALSAVSGGFSTDAVLDWLKSGMAGLTHEQIDILENYVLMWGIKGEKWFVPFGLSTTGYGLPAKDEEQRLARLNRYRTAAAVPLSALRDALNECKTGSDFARALSGHLQRTRFEKRLSRRVRALERSEPRLAAQYAQLFGVLVQSVEQLSGALGEESMDLRDFTRLLRLALAQYEVDVIPVSLDCAQACAFERQPMACTKHMFIIGAREGAMPPVQRGSGLLSESERITLETSGIELTQTAEDMAFEHQSNIYRALAGGQSLVLTAPQLGHDGAEHRESHVLARIKKLSGVSETDGAAALSRLKLCARAPAFEAACRAAGGQVDAQSVSALEFFKADSRHAEFFSSLAGWIERPRPKMTRPELVRGLYGDTISMTASRVEQIASCRFSYFCRYGLKAEPRKQARFGAPEMGSFVHEVVERSIRQLSMLTDGGDRTVEPLRIKTIVQQCINEVHAYYFRKKQTSARMNGILELLCENIIAIVQNVWLEIENSDFKPLFFELDFSPAGDLPALEIEADGANARIRGKIDRVDGWADGDTLYLKVVDYKTGRKSFKLSDVYYGLNLQMFIYLLMLGHADRAELLRRAGERLGVDLTGDGVGGALYIPAKTPWIQAEHGASEQDIAYALDKELRRVGIVNSEPRVLEALEKTGSPVHFVPVDFKKDGGLRAGSSAANTHELDLLITRAHALVSQLASALASGDVDANPYRTGKDFTACAWCEYAAACHFDTKLKHDNYRFFKALKDSEVFEKLEKENKTTYS